MQRGGEQGEPMQEQSRGGRAAALIVVAALVLAAGNVAVFVRAGQGTVSLEALAAAWYQCKGCVAFFAGAPLIAGIILAIWASRLRQPLSGPTAPEKVVAPPPSVDAALRLLALLQQEGRLVDFLEEDIAAYDDAQIGAAVRSIHEGCRRVLRERVTLERVIDREDGAPVEVPVGFDPAAIRVTGNVAGSPPFRGTLQHAGWRAAKANLPQSSTDPAIIAPAEVEVA
jgi:Domain of unknown function (DUF2760)